MKTAVLYELFESKLLADAVRRLGTTWNYVTLEPLRLVMF